MTIAQTEIDRLVDGELDEEQRRDLIGRFESSTDGWRRCALAFLEARELQTAFSSMRTMRNVVGDPILEQSASTSPSRSSRKRPLGLVSWRVLTAGVLLAFLVGLQTGRGSFSAVQSLAEGVGTTGEKQDSRQQPAPSLQKGDDPQKPAPEPQVDRPATQLADLDDENLDEIRIVGLVRLSDESMALSNYTMPVFAGRGLNQDWLSKQPLPYSQEQILRFKREGYRVQQRRQLMQIDLVDGGRLAIPFGTIQMNYVGDEVH